MSKNSSKLKKIWLDEGMKDLRFMSPTTTPDTPHWPMGQFKKDSAVILGSTNSINCPLCEAGIPLVKKKVKLHE